MNYKTIFPLPFFAFVLLALACNRPDSQSTSHEIVLRSALTSNTIPTFTCNVNPADSNSIRPAFNQNAAIAAAIFHDKLSDTSYFFIPRSEGETKKLEITLEGARYRVDITDYADPKRSDRIHIGVLFTKTADTPLQNIACSFNMAGELLSGNYVESDAYYTIMPTEHGANAERGKVFKSGSGGEPGKIMEDAPGKQIRATCSAVFLNFMAKMKGYYNL